MITRESPRSCGVGRLPGAHGLRRPGSGLPAGSTGTGPDAAAGIGQMRTAWIRLEGAHARIVSIIQKGGRTSQGLGWALETPAGTPHGRASGSLAGATRNTGRTSSLRHWPRYEDPAMVRRDESSSAGMTAVRGHLRLKIKRKTNHICKFVPVRTGYVTCTRLGRLGS